jgi:hypothetical protein
MDRAEQFGIVQGDSNQGYHDSGNCSLPIPERNEKSVTALDGHTLHSIQVVTS